MKGSKVERSQSVGTAASDTIIASSAHELKNGMTSILNFIQYCLNSTSKEDKRATALLGAERETKRCINIVRDLLTYLRAEKEGEEIPQKVSCAVILEQVFKTLSLRIKKEGVSIIQHYPEKIPEVWMKAGSIELVFSNIISNALDALKNAEIKEIHVDIHREDQFIQVIIRDTGCGVTQKNLARIFEPFFSTKSAKEGTGLGLSICKRIIAQYGGNIICESKLDTGTKFKILLPSKEGKGQQK